MTDSIEAALKLGPEFLAKGFRASAQDDASVRQMLTLLDMQDAVPSIRRLRDWVGTGVISQEQGDQARQSILAAVEAGYAFPAVAVFGFVARKPEATDTVEP
jgi:hypothetical protein